MRAPVMGARFEKQALNCCVKGCISKQDLLGKISTCLTGEKACTGLTSFFFEHLLCRSLSYHVSISLCFSVLKYSPMTSSITRWRSCHSERKWGFQSQLAFITSASWTSPKWRQPSRLCREAAVQHSLSMLLQPSKLVWVTCFPHIYQGIKVFFSKGDSF